MRPSFAAAHSHSPSHAHAPPNPILTRMAQIAELTWITIGNNYAYNLLLGMGAKQLEEWERGQQAFEAALRYNPINPMTLLHLATCLHQQHQYLAAADVLQRVLALDGNRVEALPILGHCWVMLDEPAKALPILHQALQHHNKDPKVWFVVGLFYDRQHAFKLALEAFLNQFKRETIDPDAPNPRQREMIYRLGRLFAIMGNSTAAQSCLKWSAVHPPHAVTRDHVLEQLWWWGFIDMPERLRSEKKFGSMEKWKNSQSIGKEECGEDALTWYLYGRSCLSGGAAEEAFAAYQQAIVRDPSNAAIWNSIGILYLQMRQHRDALDALSRALQHAAQAPEIWWNLGILYEACAGQDADALEAFQRARDLGWQQKADARIASIRNKSEKREESDLCEMDPIAWAPMPPFHQQSLPTQKPPLSLPRPPPPHPSQAHAVRPIYGNVRPTHSPPSYPPIGRPPRPMMLPPGRR